MAGSRGRVPLRSNLVVVFCRDSPIGGPLRGSTGVSPMQWFPWRGPLEGFPCSVPG
jgi:hypothetical protein